ncbi:unnamed protein product [Blepharisma stoltei]|uniref:Uncharacterized protein n=1 Tax=Blepharisma stoltei TaxID=1481888 RepID=A0AAU9JSH2_9CILI|nr:unnamed protein product [Blepharisma stoltei]
MQEENLYDFLNMGDKGKHKRWKSEKLNVYDCLPENRSIALRPVLIPARDIYEDYLKFKISRERLKISSKHQVKQKPEMIFTSKPKPKSSRSSFEIPNTLIDRRIRKNTTSLSKSLVKALDIREVQKESPIKIRKIPQVSAHSARSQKLSHSIQALCTHRYPEDDESPAWHKEPIRKWAVRPPAIIFSKEPKLKCSQRGKRLEFLLKNQMDKAKNDILGMLSNCQEEITSSFNESSRFN